MISTNLLLYNAVIQCLKHFSNYDSTDFPGLKPNSDSEII